MDPAEPRGDDLPTSAVTLLASGGFMLAGSTFLAWLAKGAGSAMSLRDVGDFLLGQRWPTVSRWFGLLAYVVPVCGGVAIIGAGLPARRARRVLLAAAGLASLVLLAAGLAFVIRWRAPGPGFALAVTGDALVLIGVRRAR